MMLGVNRYMYIYIYVLCVCVSSRKGKESLGLGNRMREKGLLGAWLRTNVREIDEGLGERTKRDREREAG